MASTILEKFPPTWSFLLFFFWQFPLNWFEVVSGATALAATVTGLNYHVQTSAQCLNRQTQLICHKDPLIMEMNWPVTQYCSLKSDEMPETTFTQRKTQ